VIEAGFVAAGGMALLGLAAPAGAGGRIWTYTDENGVTHFTNTPHDGRYQQVVFERPGWVGAAPDQTRFDAMIGHNAREQRLQPALVKAVIAAESNFDPKAVSHKGAQGLMQLMPKTAAWLGVSDPLVPGENVRGGTAYLRQMLDRFGDVERALAAYNAGPEAVARYGGIPPYRETQAYVRRVLAYYRDYHGDFAP